MKFMVVYETLKFLANFLIEIFSVWYIFLISSTFSCVNFDQDAFSPLIPLFFAHISALFSLRVPTIKCLGLTHKGLSHLCKTLIPSLIFPFFISKETRWASFTFLFIFILPYPVLFLLPVHNQHFQSL